MNLTQRELTSIIASAVQAALAAQQPKAAAPKAKPVARKRPAAKLQVVTSKKAARNAATGTTRAERAESRRDWKAAIACPDGTCKPFADIRTVARWAKDGKAVADDAAPVQVAKSGTELYCRHSLAS